MSSFSGRSLILILLVVIIISLIMLSYRFFAGQADGKKQTVSYAVVGEKEAPAQLIQLFQNNKKREGFARYDKTKRTYLLLNRGEQPTAGYN
ncbi:MAG: hypothetical protein UMV23_06000, partial [Halanaerobium sp.]|nr:hypothetical protein [Halanaerobium sp.]